jgi:hypothetical protein
LFEDDAEAAVQLTTLQVSALAAGLALSIDFSDQFKTGQ